MSSSFTVTTGLLRENNRKALVAYLTTGDPDLQFTRDTIIALQAAGVDMIELGVPFNHPVGDGPVIQRSAERALSKGISLAIILSFIKDLRQDGITIPVILFSYHNPVYSYGYERLATDGAKAGVSAVLVVDLPPEESRPYCGSLHHSGIDTVFLATPTTSTERLQRVADVTSGFCYYVSRSGVTGGQQDLSESLASELADIKTHIPVPVYVGFGIRTAEQAARIGKLADGVIVGTAFVECIENSASDSEARSKMLGLAASMREALDR